MKSKFKIVNLLFAKYKYVITTVIALLIIGFVGSNSMYQRYQHKLKIDELTNEIEHYKKMHKRDSLQILKLERNPKYIEKIARERYFMKQDNEDIFVFEDEETE